MRATHWRFLVRRLVGAVLTLLGVSVVVFVVLRVIPGDEITVMLGTEAAGLTDAQRASLEAYYGLGDPLVVQYFGWLGNVLTGNLGVSLRSGQPVGGLIANALPITVQLAVMATIIGVALGLAFGMLAASRPGGLRDATAQGFGLLGLGTPNFVVGAVLIAVLSTQFGYFPSAGDYVGFFESPAANVGQQIFPAITLGTALAAIVMRTTRGSYLDMWQQDFARTAVGKGVHPQRVRWRHVLHNALIPIVTITGIQFGYLLGGTVVVEEIFSLPGLGRLVLTGIVQRDFAVVQSTVLVIAALFVLVNFLVDLLYALIDPRVKLS
ncbi:ABC transporter permease [Egibacter rhizosphaerae]|uniref:ABC transporter permease n=1 Tax=Egibacter rhizosphaerae TaxID=1670831 RepID=A0A411YD31_9ACTN|nr:ABC transporter permease [Egibacter rhizosphaerae]QBI19151.1 ABC transporter permease [Egibacter rhizosphaerae]